MAGARARPYTTGVKRWEYSVLKMALSVVTLGVASVLTV